MSRDRAIGGRLVQGLRTKYFPKSRINQGLISIAPWINIILLIIMFMMMGGRLVVQSAYTVELPVGEVDTGGKPALLAVVKHFAVAGGTEAPERIFFEDESFVIGNEVQMKALLQRLKQAAAREGDPSILLFADREISNDTLVGLFGLLREAGIESVSLAVARD